MGKTIKHRHIATTLMLNKNRVQEQWTIINAKSFKGDTCIRQEISSVNEHFTLQCRPAALQVAQS
jgi:hypothetical protein